MDSPHCVGGLADSPPLGGALAEKELLANSPYAILGPLPRGGAAVGIAGAKGFGSAHGLDAPAPKVPQQTPAMHVDIDVDPHVPTFGGGDEIL